MNNEEINIAIAEACGWNQKSSHFGGSEGIWTDQSGVDHTKLPDYCNDLNAMHEAEKTLTPQQLVDMQNCLAQFEGILPFHSTAHQRAKAFLQVIGKWEEVSNWEEVSKWKEIGKCEIIGKWEEAQ